MSETHSKLPRSRHYTVLTRAKNIPIVLVIKRHLPQTPVLSLKTHVRIAWKTTLGFTPAARKSFISSRSKGARAACRQDTHPAFTEDLCWQKQLSFFSVGLCSAQHLSSLPHALLPTLFSSSLPQTFRNQVLMLFPKGNSLSALY